MEALVLSGGGSKGAFTAGVVYHLLRTRQNADPDNRAPFDYTAGTSTGSLVAGPAVLGERETLRDEYLTVSDNSEIYRNTWYGTLAGLIMRENLPLLADMSPLYDRLEDYYLRRGKLQAIRDAEKTVVAAMVNVATGEAQYVSSAGLGEEYRDPRTFVLGLLASSTEPVFCRPIQVYRHETGHECERDLFYDGGVKEFIPLERAAQDRATAIWAVSTQKPTFHEADWGRTAPEHANLLTVLRWTIDAALNEVERGDLFRGLAYRRLHEAAAQINDVATGFGLDVDQRRRLGEILDSVLPGPPLPLRKLNVIWPKRPMGAALEFSRPVMKQYFDNGINDAADYLGLQGGPPDLADLPLADEFIDGLV